MYALHEGHTVYIQYGIASSNSFWSIDKRAFSVLYYTVLAQILGKHFRREV